MEHLIIDATDRSPLIDFDHATGIFLMQGESYPEDAARFFGTVLVSVRQFLRTEPKGRIRANIELSYFNSSSAKALMNLFQTFETAAEDGADVEVKWVFRENDSAMREFGEDFAVDFNACAFNLKSKVSG